MSIQPLGWGAVKTYGFALNWKNRIVALQVLVREYNLQLTAIQHLSETQLGETIFINDWRTCRLSIHSATLKSTPSKPDKHKFWKTTLVLMGMLLQLVEWHFAINLCWVKTQGTDLWNPLVYCEAMLMILHYLTQFSLYEGPQENFLSHVSTRHGCVFLCNCFVYKYLHRHKHWLCFCLWVIC